MKTTLDLEDGLLLQAKRLAAQKGKTLTAFVEEALRARILPETRSRGRFRLRLPTEKGTAPPAIDVSDRDALYELMDSGR